MRRTLAELVVLQTHLEKMADHVGLPMVKNELDLAVNHMQLAGKAMTEALYRVEASLEN